MIYGWSIGQGQAAAFGDPRERRLVAMVIAVR